MDFYLICLVVKHSQVMSLIFKPGMISIDLSLKSASKIDLKTNNESGTVDHLLWYKMFLPYLLIRETFTKYVTRLGQREGQAIVSLNVNNFCILTR